MLSFALRLEPGECALDPSEPFENLGLAVAAIGVYKMRSDGCGEDREKSDTHQHHEYADEPAADAARVEVAVTDGRHGDDSPPDAGPDGRKVTAVERCFGCTSNHDDEDRD